MEIQPIAALVAQLKEFNTPKYENKDYDQIRKEADAVISQFAQHGSDALESLYPFLDNPETWTSLLALDAIGKIKSETSVKILVDFIVKYEDTDYYDRCDEAISSLMNIGEPAVDEIIEALKKGLKNERYIDYLDEGLSKIGGEKAKQFRLNVLKEYLANKNEYRKWFDVTMLACNFNSDDKEALPFLKELFDLKLNKGEKIEVKAAIDRIEYPESEEQIETIKPPTAEDILLMVNYLIFDGEWEWYLRDTEENGSEEQKQEDILLIRDAQKKYGNTPPEEYSATFADETEETRAMNTIASRGEGYDDVLNAIEGALSIEVCNDESLNDYDLIESLKLLKRNIEFKEQVLDRTCQIVKATLLPAAFLSGLTRHETALCIQHFIKLIKEERKENGKSSFVNNLRAKADEEMEEDDDEGYNEFWEKSIEQRYKCLMEENVHPSFAEEVLNDTIKELITDNQLAKAEKLGEKGVEWFDTMQSHYDCAMAFWASSKLEEAKSHLEKALELAEEEELEKGILKNIKIAQEKIENNEPFKIHKVTKEELLELISEGQKGAFVSPETLAAISGSTVKQIESLAEELVKEGKIEEAEHCIMYRRKADA